MGDRPFPNSRANRTHTALSIQQQKLRRRHIKVFKCSENVTGSYSLPYSPVIKMNVIIRALSLPHVEE